MRIKVRNTKNRMMGEEEEREVEEKEKNEKEKEKI